MVEWFQAPSRLAEAPESCRLPTFVSPQQVVPALLLLGLCARALPGKVVFQWTLPGSAPTPTSLSLRHTRLAIFPCQHHRATETDECQAHLPVRLKHRTRERCP